MRSFCAERSPKFEENLARRDRVRGEITLLVEAPGRSAAPTASGGETIADRVARLQAEMGLDEKAALKHLARELALPKSELYRQLQRERAHPRSGSSR